MELRDRTVVILGGSGLVGRAVARRLLAAAPRRIVLVALFEEDARAAADALASYHGGTAVEVEWGDVFLPASLARLERSTVFADPAHRAQVIHDMLGDLSDDILERSFLYQLLVPYKPDHSEERPSRPLLTKSAVAGAQSLLLFLMARTPGAPTVVEIKPTATIAWREIAYGPVHRTGKPIPLVDCPAPVPLAEAFRPGAHPWRDLGKPLEGVFIDVGENGLFSRDEFETVTALGSMEFAEYVVMELEGRPTGRDVVAALDAATAGPTYRAGILRRHAVDRLKALEERTKTRRVAYEMLGPPRLSKLLFEALVCSRLRPSVRALAQSRAAELAREAHALLERECELRSHILSVGIPILAPDGERLYRGSVVVVPPRPGDPRAAAPRGWVDLRPEQFGVWVRRAGAMLAQAEAGQQRSADSGSDVDWTAIGPDDPIEPARFASWVFRFEDRGERIKR